MSLYPTLEDMKVGHMVDAQRQMEASVGDSGTAPIEEGPAGNIAATSSRSLYPSLASEYMGLDISQSAIAAFVPGLENAPPPVYDGTVATRPDMTVSMSTGPITNAQGLVGYKRAEVKDGIREVVTCKDGKGQVGLRLHEINKGIFVGFVQRGSPAALAGLRFGDQILSINDHLLAGMEKYKAMDLLKKSNPTMIRMAVRDRPFERTLTMHKDSVGHVGFMFKDGKISKIVKNSSAARNGILTEHNLVEVDGQNVIGLRDKEIQDILRSCPLTITITIIPSYVYNHITQQMSGILFKKMDHSVPEV